MSTPIPTYAIAHLDNVRVGPQIVEYLEKIDGTLEPFHGRFLVHGEHASVIEGSWSGDLIVIEFPDRAHATAWYDSPAYQAILPLRTENSESTAVLIDGVPEGHIATDVLRRP